MRIVGPTLALLVALGWPGAAPASDPGACQRRIAGLGDPVGARPPEGAPVVAVADRARGGVVLGEEDPGAEREPDMGRAGSPAAGGITAGSPATITLGSTFYIPRTGNGALDPTADLPGPGAISLPGTLTVR